MATPRTETSSRPTAARLVRRPASSAAATAGASPPAPLLAALLLAGALLGPAPMAQRAAGASPLAEKPAPPTTATVLSRETCNGLFLVQLRWGSRGSGDDHELLALFDTGGSNLFIDPDSLERASGRRIEAGRRVSLRGVGVADTEVGFGTFRPEVRELDHLGRALGRPFDVFLPFHAFDELLLTLDYPRGEIRVAHGELPEPDGVEVFSSAGRDRRPWLRVRVGKRPRELLIDSGSTGSIALKPRRHGLRWRQRPLPLHLAHGMDDLELRRRGRLAGSVEVGPLTFVEPLASVTTDTELLGYDVLRHFVLTFDQRNRRLRLAPAVEGPVRLEAERGTGAVFRARPGGYEVAHVVEGTPAARAGVKRGDLVTHLDGTPVLERGCRDGDAEAGEVQRYTLRRGGERIELDVPVAVLIP